MNPIYGNHIGIVVNSNPDPENRGRVQIFVPYLSTTLYDKWNKDAKDISITQGSLAGISNEVLQRLQQNLPWAERASPLFGTGGTTYGDASTGLTMLSQKSSAPMVDTSGRNSLSTNNKTAPIIVGTDLTTSQTTEFSSGQKNLINLNSQDVGDQNLIKYAISLGYPESGFNSSEANSNTYNTVSNNANVAKYGLAGADLGNYQVNQMQVDALISKGYTDVDPRYGTNAEQLQAICLYLDVTQPKAASLIRSGQFSAADSLLNGQWQSLPGGTMDPLRRANGTAYNGKYGNYNCNSPSCIQDNINKAKIVQAIRNGDPSVSSIIAKATSSSPQTATNTGLTSNLNSITNKILDSTRQIPTVDLRTPNGINSTPLAGTFVWCFFLGGDVQRPVYFAGVTEKNASSRTSSAPSTPIPAGAYANTLSNSSASTLTTTQTISNNQNTVVATNTNNSFINPQSVLTRTKSPC